MNSNLRRLWLCKTSALITGAVLPCAAFAHPVFTRSPDSRVLTKLAQLAVRKSSVYLLVGHHPTTVATNISTTRSIIASNNSEQLQQQMELQSQIQAANQRIASMQAKSSKSQILLWHPRTKTLLNQLRLINRTERRSELLLNSTAAQRASLQATLQGAKAAQ